MSWRERNWVKEHSPWKGYRPTDFLLHLEVAELANEANRWEVWITPSRLAARVGCARSTASDWLWRAARDGWLDVVEDNRCKTRRNLRNVASRFRVLFPGGDLACVAEPADEPAVCVAEEPERPDRHPGREARPASRETTRKVKTDLTRTPEPVPSAWKPHERGPLHLSAAVQALDLDRVRSIRSVLRR